MELQPAHAERLHDLVGAVAGVDQDRLGAAEDQEAVDRNAPGAAAVVAEHEEAGFELDVAESRILISSAMVSLPSHCLALRSDPVDASGGVVEDGLALVGAQRAPPRREGVDESP